MLVPNNTQPSTSRVYHGTELEKYKSLINNKFNVDDRYRKSHLALCYNDYAHMNAAKEEGSDRSKSTL